MDRKKRDGSRIFGHYLPGWNFLFTGKELGTLHLETGGPIGPKLREGSLAKGLVDLDFKGFITLPIWFELGRIGGFPWKERLESRKKFNLEDFKGFPNSGKILPKLGGN